MDFELYKGLPLKTIMVEHNEYENYYGVTTDIIDSLISYVLNTADLLDIDLEEFDQNYSYAVPQEIFKADEKTIINFINENIDKIL